MAANDLALSNLRPLLFGPALIPVSGWLSLDQTHTFADLSVTSRQRKTNISSCWNVVLWLWVNRSLCCCGGNALSSSPNTYVLVCRLWIHHCSLHYPGCLFTLKPHWATESQIQSLPGVRSAVCWEPAHLLSLRTWDHWTGTLLTLKQQHIVIRSLWQKKVKVKVRYAVHARRTA